MTLRPSLHAGPDGIAFRTSDHDRYGLPRRQLRLRALDQPHHGIRTLDLPLETITGRCRAYLPLLHPGRYFSHATAALLYGIPLPRRLEADPRLHASTVGPGTRPRGRDIAGHELEAGTVVTGMYGIFPVVGPADTWFHLAALLGEHDLIAAGDRLISGMRTDDGRLPPLCTAADLEDARGRHRHQRGIRLAGRCLPLLRAPVDSRPESILRRVLVDAGLPEPVVADPTLVDGGTAVLHPDLKWPQWRIVLEYEGDGHRDPQRFLEDIRRRERLEAAGWHVIRVTRDDLAHRARFLARVREHIAHHARP